MSRRAVKRADELRVIRSPSATSIEEALDQALEIVGETVELLGVEALQQVREQPAALVAQARDSCSSELGELDDRGSTVAVAVAAAHQLDPLELTQVPADRGRIQPHH